MVLSAALSGNVLADLNDGLVAYYPFNGNAKDESGNGNDGTVNGATLTEDRFRKKKSAYEFNGNGNFIIIQNDLTLNPSTLTISVWVKISLATSTMDIVSKDGEGLERQYLITRNSQRKFRAHIGMKNNNFYHYDGQTTTVLDKWYHIVQTYDGSLLKLYVNGQYEYPSYNNSANNGTTSSTQPLRIGGGAPSEYSQYWFNGIIDDVRIYNRALSESEIQQLYATTLETNIFPKDSGTITKSPEKTSYSLNEEVTLTAKPAKGYKFKQWQGDASGSKATITIKMNGNQNVTAVFEEEEDEQPPIEISSKAIYDSKTKTLSLEGILVPYIDEFTGKATDNKGIFDAQLQEKTKLVFELIPWSINFKDMFEGKDTSGYINYHPTTRSVDIPCFKVTTIAQFGDGIEGEAIYYKDVILKQRHVNYQIFHVEDMTETDSCN